MRTSELPHALCEYRLHNTGQWIASQAQDWGGALLQWINTPLPRWAQYLIALCTFMAGWYLGVGLAKLIIEKENEK